MHKTLASSQFRLLYTKLTEPTDVTVSGHVIGTWTPASQSAPAQPAQKAEPAVLPRQSVNDILNKVNRKSK